ncbi:MAG: ADP-ribosylglycohydrolase family protein [Lachnospirales bacterium]
MYGAILGDIIGSPFEFDRGDKTKDFKLFTKGCKFTDDSVMTAAVAEALITVGPDATKEEIKEAVTNNMQDWGKRYPYAGYGCRFRNWLKAPTPKPYKSFGNGSAMRVSSVGWLYPTLERTREVAVYTAEVTHNHKEGIKGAEATASCIFLARQGANKGEIRDYVVREFGYNLNRTLDEIRPTYHHIESCQQTVPEAIIAFLESENFEDAIRNAVSLGGDTDTLGAITGSIAEAFYGISAILKAECLNRVSDDILNVIQLFDEAIGRKGVQYEEYEELSGNKAIENAINQLYEKDDDNCFWFFITELCERMKNNGEVLVPFVTVEKDMFSDFDECNLKEGDILTLDCDVRMNLDTVTEGNNEEWFYFFTNKEGLSHLQFGNIIMSMQIYDIMEMAYKSDKVKGLVINPFGKYVKLTKEILGFILQEFTKNWKED